MRFIATLLLLFPLISHAANAEYLKIYLMQDKNLILGKMDGVDEMGRYVKEVERSINKEIAALPAAKTWGFIVIAVRDDGKIKAWLDTDDKVPADVAKAMVSIAETTKAFAVKKGAVIFSLGFATDGAELPVDKVPFPNEWKQVANCTNEDCAEKNAEEIVLNSW
ncbi:MAG: hypothetical protein WBP13_06065 [Methylophilaceae bacterium]